MKFKITPTTTINEVLLANNGNKTETAKALGINRGTLRKYIAKKDKVLILDIDDQLVPFVADRRQGHHKKGSDDE